MNNIEIRSFDVEFRNDPDSRYIEGYGSVFNKRSLDFGGWIEIIAPGAFDGVIEESDVKCYLDHNPNRGILARSKNGSGSLSLKIDETGLNYSFDAPKTALGDEVVEGLKRGDYSQSSFAFTVKDQVWTKEDDGTILRTIVKVERLYDVSIVADPAYPDTSVALRSFNEFTKSLEEREEGVEQVEVPAEVVEETPQKESTEDENLEVEKVEETPKEETPGVEVTETQSEEETLVVENQENNIPEVQEADPKDERKYINQNNIMNNSFSLIQTISDVIANRSINDDALSVIAEGAKEMRKSGLSFAGQIQLPVEHRNDTLPTDGAVAATVATQGKEIVATDKLNILGPLRGESILSKVGATFLTGLVGNISIPTYSGSTAGWKGELEEAGNGIGSFGSVELSPKRLTCYIDISKQFLAQDSVGAENLLRKDIVDAITSKLEETIFGDEAGTTDRPAGLLYNAEEVNPSYSQVCDDEASLTDFRGEKFYVLSPSAKSAFKQTTISGSQSDLRLLCEDNEINGYKTVSSSNVVTGGYLFGDFSELIVAQWGAIDIVVDPYTLATKNAVRLVINAFFDAKLRRSGAVKGALLETGSDSDSD